MNKISKKSNLNIYYANIIARMHTKFTLEEEKALHLIFKQINSFEKNDTTIKLNKLDFFFNYVEKYGWPKIIHQFTLKILFLIKNLLKVTLFSVKIL